MPTEDVLRVCSVLWCGPGASQSLTGLFGDSLVLTEALCQWTVYGICVP